MENQSKLIKKIEPILCPHCNKNIFVGSQSMISSIISVSTEEEIKETKNKIKERLNEITFNSDEDKQEILDFINDDTTLLDSSDIEPLLKQIAIEQINKSQQKNDSSK